MTIAETAEEGTIFYLVGVRLSYLLLHLGSPLIGFADSRGQTRLPSKGRPALAYPAPLYGFCWKFGL